MRIAATSEPAPGSDTPMQATMSPAIAGARNSCCSSGEPKRASAGVAMSVCTPIDIGTAPQRHAPSASAIDDRVAVVEAGAADRLGLGQPEQAQVAELPEHLVRRIDAGVLPFVDVRVEFLAAEPLDRAPQFLVFVREEHAVFLGQGRATPKLSGRRRTWSARRNRCSTCVSTRRVSRGSMMPSSSMRPDV